MPWGAVHPIWFTPGAVEAWRGEPRTGRGGQPRYSAMAIATALTLRAVFRLALRQAEGLIGHCQVVGFWPERAGWAKLTG